MSKRIAIIGGGISGVVSAIELAKDGNIIDIYEKRNVILRGPPYCHLHAGGMLYPEISLKDAQILLNDCIKFANKFPEAIEHRPTIIAYRKNSEYSTDNLLLKCRLIRLKYLLSKNMVLGPSESYYAIYYKEDIEYYKKNLKFQETKDLSRLYHNKYVENFCKMINDIDSIKYPFVSVCEPGINKDKVEINLINKLHKYKMEKKINIYTKKDINPSDLKGYDTIINASASNFNNFNENSYILDKKESYEYKSSWIIKCNIKNIFMPEIAVIGERETEQGMIQISPINNNKFQVHCMTSRSTIIDTKSNREFKLLNQNEIELRGNEAIKRISEIFPIFLSSDVIGACPGIQRIPYDNKSKRISYIEKNTDANYYELKLMKACSVISLTEILCKLVK